MISKEIKKIITAVIAAVVIATSVGHIKTSATETIPFKVIDKVNYINMVELAKALNMEYTKGDTNVIKLKKDITLVATKDMPHVYINDSAVALDDKELNNKVIWPLSVAPYFEGDSCYLPIDIVKKYVDVDTNDKGVIIKKEVAEDKKEEDKKEESNNTQSGNSSTGSSSSGNSGSSSSGGNSGSSSNGNTSSGGSTSGSSKPSGGSSSSGSGSSGGSTSGGNTTPTPQPTPTPTPTPTPEPTPTPQPEPQPQPTPQPPAVTGISFSAFKQKLDNCEIANVYPLGYDCYGTVAGEMRVYADSSMAEFSLVTNTTDVANALKTMFNLLLPTEGNRLYNIITTSSSNATYTMDGRTVTITCYPQGVEVNIR